MAVIGNAPATTGTTVSAQSFNGDASTVAFTLNRSVNSTVDLEVLVDNVQQSPYDGSYSVSGTTLTFSSAPASGTNNVYVIYRGATIATAQVVPDDGSVSTAKLQSGVALNNLVSGGTQIGGRRNLVINGDMRISQRGTSWTGLSYAGAYRLDRFYIDVYGGAYSISQDTDAPSGFANSLKIDCTTAETPLAGASDGVIVWYNMEGQDLQHLKKGTADAESVTLSFWVKSNKTGNFQVNLQDRDNSRLIGSSVNISAADTWEHKTITYAGDTTGTLDNDNNVSLNIEMWFDAGSNFTGGAVPTSWESKSNTDRAAVNFGLTDSTANYVNITGVQLEVGTVATPFEHRSYGEELALCQRYYQKSFAQGVTPQDGQYTVNVTTAWESSTNARGNWIPFPVEMRATPTFTQYGNSSNWQVFTGSSWQTTTNSNVGASVKSYGFYPTIVGGVTNSNLHPWYAKGDYTVDAEL